MTASKKYTEIVDVIAYFPAEGKYRPLRFRWDGHVYKHLQLIEGVVRKMAAGGFTVSRSGQGEPLSSYPWMKVILGGNWHWMWRYV